MRAIPELIALLIDMKARNAFKNYIDYMQFPHFRNLEKDSRITFDFPLTVFVGQNGSGKSSTLHALYGAPKRNTPFEFWFSTAVDPIVEVSAGGDRHCFFYVYKDKGGNDLEVLKLRIFKRNNPDYWETSRPVAKYGMQLLPDGVRNDPIKKNVVYLDFRAELSAFDKYFYFKQPRRTTTIKNKQDFLRKYSVFLRKIIDRTERIIIRYGKQQNQPLREMSEEELTHISFILGKTYLSGKIVRHKLFEEWGYSVVFETPSYSYSEAFAGSGEMAVVRLVLDVLAAPTFSLILLDEPEVSLHPGAQKRLKHFILDQIRRKQLQVVVSSHSPSFVEDLPPQAIKVFSQMPTGKFNVKPSSTPEEAFYHLEQTNPSRKTIIVEDYLANIIVDAILVSMGAATASLFDVTFYTGGQSILKNNFITIFSREQNSNKFIFFDGDQNTGAHFDPDSVIATQQTNENFKQKIRHQTGMDIQIFPDGSSETGARIDQEKKLRKEYLKYYLRNVFYLPRSIPEEIIWDNSFCENFLNGIGKNNVIQQISDIADHKEKFRQLAIAMTGDNSSIDTIQKMFLQHWIANKNNDYTAIVNLINQIKVLP